MKFRYKEYCAGTFLLYRKLLSCKVKNAARGCAKAHSLFYERKKKRKQGKVSKNVMDYKLLLDMAVFAGDILMQNVSGGRYGLPDPAEIESEDSAGSGDDDRICCHAG